RQRPKLLLDFRQAEFLPGAGHAREAPDKRQGRAPQNVGVLDEQRVDLRLEARGQPADLGEGRDAIGARVERHQNAANGEFLVALAHVAPSFLTSAKRRAASASSAS